MITQAVNMKSFNDIFDKFQCRPIPGCPGRYIIKNSHHLSVKGICGTEAETEEFTSGSVPDPVIVCRFDDGGIISYRKPDGSFVHTLNNNEGFKRKCRDLDIQL